MIELLLVLLLGNIITNVKINNFSCDSNYVGDQSDGDVGIIYLCNYAKRMEYSEKGVLEWTNPQDTPSNR